MLRSEIFLSFVKMKMLQSGNLGLKIGVSRAAHSCHAPPPPPRGRGVDLGVTSVTMTVNCQPIDRFPHSFKFYA